jgi:hypothetical protein
MLDPQDRQLLLDALRPPEGFDLSFAIGTTYTLDLLALLTAPLGFTVAELRTKPGAELAPMETVRLLGTLRRYAGRVAMFCQAGRIAVPSRHAPLFAELERSVVEVLPPSPEHSFHPKVWVLRFESPAGEVAYRLICASRNLTFDRAWDTVLLMDGELTDRVRGYAANRPLAEFVDALPSMALTKVSPSIRKFVATAADELRRVDFHPPEQFEDYRCWALGIEGQPRWPFRDCHRTLVVSPFLSEKTLGRLRDHSRDCLLISRAESLDEIPSAQIREFDEVCTLTPDAVAEIADAETPTHDDPLATAGLHAKLYVLERGWDASVFTGSANATTAAFNGNVEFMVELIGKKSRCGIDTLLQSEKGRVGLGDMIAEYEPPEQVAEVDVEAKRLEELLETARRALAGRAWTATIEPAEATDCYRVTLSAKGRFSLPSEVDVVCRPVLLPESAAVAVQIGRGAEATFESVSFEGLTSFFAFELTVAGAAASASCRFTVNATLVGEPENRRERLTQYMLRDRRQVVAFLLLLLAGNVEELVGVGDEGKGERDWGSDARYAESEALLEPLLRALDRDPSSLDDVAALIDDLGKTPDGRAKLPDGLDAIWHPIWALRAELEKEAEA